MAWNVIRKDPFAANEIKTKGAFIKYLFSFFFSCEGHFVSNSSSFRIYLSKAVSYWQSDKNAVCPTIPMAKRAPS